MATFDPTVDQTRRTGAGTEDNPLTDIQISDLASQGIREGDTLEGKGVLTPQGTFRSTPVVPSVTETGDVTIGEQLAGAGTGGFNTAPFEEGQEFDPFDEDAARKAARRNQLRLHQSEIDATNKVFDQLLSEARLEGEGRLGSDRARQARGGLLGSSFAGAKKERIQDFNTAEQQRVENERLVAIGNIMSGVRSAVEDEVAAKRTARAAGTEEYTQFLQNRSARKQEYVQRVVADAITQGFDLSTLTPEELDEIGRPAGITTQELLAAYASGVSGAEAAGAEADLATRKTESEIAKNQRVTLSGGQALFDQEGNLIASRDKQFAPQSGGSGGGFSESDEQVLLAGGYDLEDLSTLKDGVDEHGLPFILEEEREAGATEAQIAALNKAYGATTEEPSKLTRENIASLYGLTEGDTQPSFLGIEYGQTQTEQIDAIMKIIEQRQALGIPDKDILKEIQG